MYSEEDLLPVSLLQHLLFCERRAALVQIERIWADNLFTVEGTHLHEKVDDDVPVESRGNIRICRGLMMRSLRLGFSGKADVVEFHEIVENAHMTSGDLDAGIALPGVTGLWRPYPVDYKRGRLRREPGFEVQLCAQALCLEEMLGVAVPAGAIFYGKPHRRLEILFDTIKRQETIQAAARLHELITTGITPQARKEPKCKSCSLVEYCLPGVTDGRRNVRRYLESVNSEW